MRAPRLNSKIFGGLMSLWTIFSLWRYSRPKTFASHFATRFDCRETYLGLTAQQNWTHPRMQCGMRCYRNSTNLPYPQTLQGHKVNSDHSKCKVQALSHKLTEYKTREETSVAQNKRWREEPLPAPPMVPRIPTIFGWFNCLRIEIWGRRLWETKNCLQFDWFEMQTSTSILVNGRSICRFMNLTATSVPKMLAA